MQDFIKGLLKGISDFEEYLGEHPIVQQIFFKIVSVAFKFVIDFAKDVYENKKATQWIICKRCKKCRKHKKH